MAIVEGKKAPPFSLIDADGKTVTLADFAGKDLIVYFYPKDNTPGCTKEACGFRDQSREFAKSGAVVVGVSPDKEASHREFREQFQLEFPLLCDPDKKMMKAYGAYGEKTMYGKTSEGVIRSTVWIGPNGVVKKQWKKVANAEDHPGHVLRALMGEA